MESFAKDIGDGKVIYALASLFHTLSQQQEGLRIIYDCGGIPRLFQFLEYETQISPFLSYKFFSSSSSVDSSRNYIITTLHNFLVVLQAQAAHEIERCEGIQKLINLLDSSNEKLLTLVSDSLLKLSIYNKKAKVFIQNSEQCTQHLLNIFDNTPYDKLLLTISKLLPIITSGNELIKRIILQVNGLNIFEKRLRTTKSLRIKHNILITLRNISNQATRMVK